ncbi:copper/iron-regulated glutamine amidotransferase [Apiospora rasikravindrae]|uniref:Copper/iron-regulated glutamine amidotransferase n=1 Tax=Apiospora rasikravindrae TaxID=990691 RepID=A0ABR1RPW5_9PEZI
MLYPSSFPEDPPPPLRIAVCLNSYNSRFLPAIQASYVRVLGRVAPGAQLTFFESANKGEFPDPIVFDLIVLAGANVDPRASWDFILKIHNFIRTIVAQYPDKKVVGICWGHQTISRVFGADIVDMSVPEMGVTSINLTEEGRKFFPHAAATGAVRLQQHHRREVAAAPAKFTPLAQGSQIFLNDNNTILTFQGHPEKDAQTARLRLHDTQRWFGFNAVDEKAWAKLEAQIETEHDGDEIWKRIMHWVREPSRGLYTQPS